AALSNSPVPSDNHWSPLTSAQGLVEIGFSGPPPGGTDVISICTAPVKLMTEQAIRLPSGDQDGNKNWLGMSRSVNSWGPVPSARAFHKVLLPCARSCRTKAKYCPSGENEIGP